MLCPARIEFKQPSRPYGAGRAHQSCVKAQGRAAALANTPTPRTKKPYDAIGPTQQWKRRKQAMADITNVLQQHGVPMEAIHSPPTPSPVDVLHLSTAERERVRTVQHLRIPCERTIIKCKKQLPATHATGTGTFGGGAFMTDPVRFVTVLCAQSSFIAVGGDAGGSEACHHRALGGLQRGIGPARPQRAGDQQVDQERMQHDHAGSYWRIFRPPCCDNRVSLHPQPLAAAAAALLASLGRLVCRRYRRLAHGRERHPSALDGGSTFQALSEAAHAASLRRICGASSLPGPRVGGADRVLPCFLQRPLPQAASQPGRQHGREAAAMPGRRCPSRRATPPPAMKSTPF